MASKPENAKKENWTKEMVLEFCQFLNKYITKHGRTSPFKWVSLQPEFERAIKHKFNSKCALKNKYDSMRKDYNLWKSLKNGETGLGWNESTKQLNCSNEWWKTKTTENSKYAAIRRNQPSAQLQDEWDQLFGDVVASGSNCVAPSMDSSTINDVHVENLVDDDVDMVFDANDYQVNNDTPSNLEDLETEDPNFYSNLLNEAIQQTTSAPVPSEVAKKFDMTSKINTKPKPANMKRKGRESTGSLMLKNHLAQSSVVQQRALQILEADSSKLDESTKFTIGAAVGELNRMVDVGLMTEAGDLWLFAIDLFEDPVKREIFINMRSDNARLAWLQRKQNP
ncbi:L10-interacting MYB domain-containing protein-like [Rutidosis leptorrhynchoides]|uniref:L10-interacting MYB domain-containing protein-like n=1 Tax=Rutidosis leptorrhynchoides TaxID=125765 RepID=UPI003A98EECC